MAKQPSPFPSPSPFPLIPYGWLRAILLLAVYLLGVIGLAQLSLDFYSSFTIVFIFSMLLLLAFRKLVDRASFISLGLNWKGFEIDAAAGFFMGIAILGTGTCLLLLLDQVEWIDLQFNGNSFGMSLILMLMVAFSEELIFRGYVLGNLRLSMSTPAALLVSAALFAIFHIGNPNTSWLAIVNVFIAGILLGINYCFTGNCWFSIALHFAWNFFQGPVLGFKVSGLELPSVLSQRSGENILLTGGPFGFEGSLIETILSIIAILILIYAYKTKYNLRVTELFPHFDKKFT